MGVVASKWLLCLTSALVSLSFFEFRLGFDNNLGVGEGAGRGRGALHHECTSTQIYSMHNTGGPKNLCLLYINVNNDCLFTETLLFLWFSCLFVSENSKYLVKYSLV